MKKTVIVPGWVLEIHTRGEYVLHEKCRANVSGATKRCWNCKEFVPEEVRRVARKLWISKEANRKPQIRRYVMHPSDIGPSRRELMDTLKP
jgi:hypothetical protein